MDVAELNGQAHACWKQVECQLPAAFLGRKRCTRQHLRRETAASTAAQMVNAHIAGLKCRVWEL